MSRYIDTDKGMGVYIPFMMMPNKCEDCLVSDYCIYFKMPTSNHTGDKPSDCSLTTDIVEVVRCKDCKYWDNHDDANRCKHESGGMWAKPDAFCCYGERREALAISPKRTIYQCPSCGIHIEYLFNYCPNCGAEMDERREK